ncbi:hypothetical protein LSH36_399g05020, partial [Paralvinella palmiformis]
MMMAPGRREAFLALRERLSNSKPEMSLDKDDPDEKSTQEQMAANLDELLSQLSTFGLPKPR